MPISRQPIDEQDAANSTPSASFLMPNVQGKGLAATHPTNEKMRENHKTQSKPLTASPA